MKDEKTLLETLSDDMLENVVAGRSRIRKILDNAIDAIATMGIIAFFVYEVTGMKLDKENKKFITRHGDFNYNNTEENFTTDFVRNNKNRFSISFSK